MGKLLQSIREADIFTPSEAQTELIDDLYEFHELVEHYKKRNEEMKKVRSCTPRREMERGTTPAPWVVPHTSEETS